MIESLLLSITFFLLLIISSPSVESKIDPKFEACSGRKTCRDNQTIKYPFYIDNLQEPFCGSPGFKLTCDNNNSGYPLLKLSGNYYRVHNISYENQTLRVSNAAVSTNDCIPFLQNTSLPDDRTFYLPDPNQRQLYLFYNCHINISGSGYYNGCDGYNRSVAGLVGEAGPYLSAVKRECNESESLMVVAPIDGDIEGEDKNDNSIGQVLRNGFVMKWKAGACQICNDSGGVCGFDNVAYRFMCYCRDRPHFNHCSSGKNHLPLQLSLGIGIPALILLCLFVILWCFKKRLGSLNFLSRNISSQPHSKSDLEGGCVYFGVPVFSYSELDEATHNFNSAKEVGDGGFGTVYHGKLKDGREVAVKRLYEHNYKRVEQFMNEVEILTRLRHTNLVSLYGCTSLKSQELLLVYEFIPNGTLSDHLHGDLANPSSSLTWPLRMQIAIETASALAYLHASDIIHRDVKTNNILLDHNFSVKVADFGLSRLFPNDATHVSTAPQGTPGYVDPEYHQCYQLTCKSDVYSFGVVLMELISSMPAVDISRDKHEINLSNLAISKIRKRAFDEFVDKSLGFESDSEVRRMTIAVAELGLQCLHLEIESRPPMDEVLKDLKGIQRGEVEPENEGVNDLRRTHSPECDEVGSLKNTKMPSSPISVTDKWPSISTPSSRSVEVP